MSGILISRYIYLLFRIPFVFYCFDPDKIVCIFGTASPIMIGFSAKQSSLIALQNVFKNINLIVPDIRLISLDRITNDKKNHCDQLAGSSHGVNMHHVQRMHHVQQTSQDQSSNKLCIFVSVYMMDIGHNLFNEKIKRELTCLKFNLDFMRKGEREIT